MVIYEPDYEWSYEPGLREETRYIILHHSAGQGSAEAIHAYHRDSRGWAGIAYHYYIRMDGSVWRGRPEDWNGGHSSGYNSISVGVCFEGNFEEHDMPAEQLQSGKELIAQLRKTYPDADMVRHGELNATACPGRYFPFDELVSDEREELMYRTLGDVPEYYREAIRALMERGVLMGRENSDPDALKDNILDLSEDYCRVMTTLHRLGVF